jgi:hypothetical protein
MARSKEDKQQFIKDLKAAAAAIDHPGLVIPVSIGRSYSRFNALCILSQDPAATNVAGFYAWRDAGRAINKGSKGIAVLVPMGTYTDDDGDDVMRFSWRYVFDIRQTHPITDADVKTLKQHQNA